ncbi:MAG: hypothetical protein ISR52_01465 [Rhodospirillales bacterium]|nr:hypothetical protein [Rhodospirillales bacterium]
MQGLFADIPALIYGDLYHLLPPEAQAALIAAGDALEEGRLNDGASSALEATDRVLRRLYRCRTGEDAPEDRDRILAVLEARPAAPVEMLHRLRLVFGQFPDPALEAAEDYTPDMAHYLMVSVIDLCERMVTEPDYQPPVPEKPN